MDNNHAPYIPHSLYEQGDLLNRPFECFDFDSEANKFPVKPHWHHYMELIFLLDGSARMCDASNEYILAPGDLIVFHPKALHSIYSADGKPVRFYGIKLDISRMNTTASYSPKLRSIFRYAEKKNTRIKLTADQLKGLEIEKIFRRCIDECAAQRYGYDVIIRSEIYRLLIEILRIWQNDGFVIDSEAFIEDSVYDIFSVTEYIDNNLSARIKVSDIAAACGMSYSYFAKKFLAVYGKTCKEYIEEVRICKAEEFLMFTDFDLTYISQETGFSDCSHMIRSFKQAMGVTPKQYRLRRDNG